MLAWFQNVGYIPLYKNIRVQFADVDTNIPKIQNLQITETFKEYLFQLSLNETRFSAVFMKCSPF